jgi:hypothetical protein
MHRLNKASCLCFLTLVALEACGGEKKEAEDPASKGKAESPDVEEKTTTANAENTDKKGDAGAGEKAAEKKDVCSGFDLANLEDLLSKSDCEVPDTRPDSLQNPDMKGKLEVVVTASPTKIAAGGKVDLMVTFANKTKEPMPLNFRIDPVARFETEAYDAKKKRADMPAGQPPAPPKGHSAPPPAEAKVAKVTIAPSGFARVRVAWDAVKMKWAPLKVRGTAVERGYPRSPAGPLPKGKYTVKVVTPLIGVFEGADHEVSAPKVEIEVGG